MAPLTTHQVTKIVRLNSGLVIFYHDTVPLHQTKKLSDVQMSDDLFSIVVTNEHETPYSFKTGSINEITTPNGTWTYTALDADTPSLENPGWAERTQEILVKLAEEVFVACCDDDECCEYQIDKYGTWLVYMAAEALPQGKWIGVTHIPSQPGAVFALFCTSNTEIALGGFGSFKNADWQNVGDYAGVFTVTGVTPGTNIGQWYAGLGVMTINYVNLLGGTFAAGETITDSITGATAVIITDNAATTLTAYVTSSGLAFGVGNNFDNGTGVSADVSTVTITGTALEQGDIVIWNGLHYQLVDASLQDGTDPATNTTAFTELDITVSGMGYIQEVDEIEFVFNADWLQYRKDKRGNVVQYCELTDAVFALGFTAINLFQWGRDTNVSNTILDAKADVINLVGFFSGNTMFSYSRIETVTADSTSNISNNTLKTFSTVSGGTIINGTLAGNEFHDTSTFDTFAISEKTVSGNQFEDGCIVQSCNFTVTGTFVGNTIGSVVTVSGKTFETDFNQNSIYLDFTVSEVLSVAITNTVHGPGLSTQIRDIDITGLTTIDFSATEQVGLYNVTSGNAAESVDMIQNFPLLFPFQLFPATGLTLTITFTGVGGIAGNQIAGPVASAPVVGTNGDSITLEAATINAASVTKQISLQNYV